MVGGVTGRSQCHEIAVVRGDDLAVPEGAGTGIEDGGAQAGGQFGGAARVVRVVVGQEDGDAVGGGGGGGDGVEVRAAAEPGSMMATTLSPTRYVMVPSMVIAEAFGARMARGSRCMHHSSRDAGAGRPSRGAASAALP
jgi:hypothetical protein